MCNMIGKIIKGRPVNDTKECTGEVLDKFLESGSDYYLVKTDDNKLRIIRCWNVTEVTDHYNFGENDIKG